jgi:hypothetical protein
VVGEERAEPAARRVQPGDVRQESLHQRAVAGLRLADVASVDGEVEGEIEVVAGVARADLRQGSDLAE